MSAEFFGELDISSVREEDLWSYKQKHPHLLRYDPAEYISCLEIFYAMGKRARFDWPLAIKKGIYSQPLHAFIISLIHGRVSPFEGDAQRPGMLSQ